METVTVPLMMEYGYTQGKRHLVKVIDLHLQCLKTAQYYRTSLDKSDSLPINVRNPPEYPFYRIALYNQQNIV